MHVLTVYDSPLTYYRNRDNFIIKHIQENFNGSNNLGTITICFRQGQFELISVNHSARSGGIIGIFFSIFFIRRVPI